MSDEIKEIIDSYRNNKTPKNVERTLKEYSCAYDSPGIIRDDYDVDRSLAFLPMSEVDVKSFSMHDTLAEDKEKLLKILLRYVKDVIESIPYNELSPYWICFHGFEGENGDLSKEEYELLMKYKGKLWE